MSEEKVGNRYLVMVGAIVVQLCLGTIYAWSEFQNTLKLEVADGGLYAWDPLFTQLPFAAGLASFAVFMVFAGRWQDRVGPKKVATAGALLLGAGYILASFVDNFAADPLVGTVYLIITYGIIGGAGIGFAYVCPIAALVKWFPDKKGSVSGIAVAGFGGGALIFLYVEQYLINLNGGLIGQPFLVLGIIYLIGVLLGAQMLNVPPAGYAPPGWTPPATTADGAGTGMMPGEMIKQSTFWLLWLMFVFAATAGLMTLGNVKSAAAEVDPLVELLGLGALIGGIMSIFNAAGRIVWGSLSDKLGRVMTMLLMFIILAIALFGFAGIITLLPSAEGNWILVTVIASVIGFCFGGNFALFPSATADTFGSENVGKNYGVMFTSYGIAGIVGALVAGQFVRVTGSYFLAFVTTGILAVLAIILTLVLRTKVKA
jgi:OFA family oxalate/formate antiporter-like MFS transporter